jgi:uncharacterized protein involved in outer membrane biogenesis
MARGIAIAGAAVLAIVAVVVGIIIGAAGFVLAFYDTNDLKQLAANAASAAIGRKVSIDGEANLHLGRVTRVHLADLSVANAEWAKTPKMVQVDRLDVALDVWQLLRGQLVFPQIDISGPDVVLEKNAKGEPNWQFSTAAKGAAQAGTPAKRTAIPVVQQLNLDRGRFVYADASANRSAGLDVAHLKVTDDRPDRKVEVIGDGKYRAQLRGESQGGAGPFALRFSGGPWAQLVATDKPYPIDLALTLGDLQTKVTGTITDPAKLTGVDLKLDVHGDDTANLYPISGIALPPSPPYSFAGKVDHRGNEWRVTDLSGRMGGSDMRGTVAVDTGRDRLLLKADVVSDNLLAKDLGPVIGARPGGQAGEEAAKQEAVGRADGKVLPDKEIDLSRLNAVDADVAFKANHIDIPILPFDRLETKLTLDHGTLQLKPAIVRIGHGTVRTDLSLYGSEKPVRVETDTQIERVNLKELVRGTSFAQQTAGILGGRVQLHATGTSVAQILGTSNGEVFVVSAGGQFSHLLIELVGLDIAHSLQVAIEGDNPIPIRCIVADLPAKDGVFTAKTLIFDTTNTIVQGKGTINMRDERMDITIIPVPKDFSPLTLRNPIRAQGTFANPSVFTDPAGLGVEGTLKKIVDAVLTAVVGLAPPIDEGVGKDSDCNALIQQAKGQKAQRG